MANAHARERPGEPPTEEELVLLSLLATGLKDDAAAARLGWNPRTLRRRLRSAMTKLGAASRFQAGYLAAAAGWIPSGGEGPDAGSGHGFVQSHKGDAPVLAEHYIPSAGTQPGPADPMTRGGW